MKKIYFAHPYSQWNSDEANMIENILESRGYAIINAFKMKEDHLIKKYGTEYYSNPTVNFAGDIVKEDLLLLESVDEYLGWFKDGCMCIGSSIEFYHAKIKGKPTKVICNSPHPFLYTMADEFYESIEKFKSGHPLQLP
ncbi:MAG: hypothetical protein ACTSUE_08195 [Promethearchaeota archaeon]